MPQVYIETLHEIAADFGMTIRELAAQVLRAWVDGDLIRNPEPSE
jgi:hypothetical protein